MGEIAGEVDVTIVLLYVFWGFFFYLVFYLQRESRREGYPLESDETGKLENAGVFMPSPKTFLLPHGHGEVVKPDNKREEREIKLRPTRVWGGAPKEPTGSNPLLDGVGPGSYAERADVPDVTLEGEAKIVPLRVTEGYVVSKKDTSPIGMEVMGCDGRFGGTVTDVWVDQSERFIRFYEVEPTGAAEGARVLIPTMFTVVRRGRGRKKHVYVHAITGGQIADIPPTKSGEQVTMLEEEKIYGYLGAGLLYATPERQRPALFRY